MAVLSAATMRPAAPLKLRGSVAACKPPTPRQRNRIASRAAAKDTAVQTAPSVASLARVAALAAAAAVLPCCRQTAVAAQYQLPCCKGNGAMAVDFRLDDAQAPEAPALADSQTAVVQVKGAAGLLRRADLTAGPAAAVWKGALSHPGRETGPVVIGRLTGWRLEA